MNFLLKMTRVHERVIDMFLELFVLKYEWQNLKKGEFHEIKSLYTFLPYVYHT